MPGSRLISGYLAELAAELPAQVVEELADGLCETWRRYLNQGLDGESAAEAAIAEFGEPQVVLAAFTRASPARRAARRLLATGPAVGACWAAVLVTGRAWAWPVPVQARIAFGVILISAIGLLALAALADRYRIACRAARAGCGGIAALDTAMIISAALAAPVVTWPLILAGTASTARLLFTAAALRPSPAA